MSKMKELPVCKVFVAEDIIKILSLDNVFKIATRIREGEFTLSELNDLLYTFVAESYIGRETFLKFIHKLEEVHAFCNYHGYLY